MEQAEFDILQKEYLKKFRDLNVKLGAEYHTQLYCWFKERNEYCIEICLCRAITDGEYYGLWIEKPIETYTFTKGAAAGRWSTTFELLKTRIRELLPNEKKYFLYKELSEIAQYNFDVGYHEWVYEECCQNQYSSMHEYIEKEIREKRLKYDRRIYEEDGEMGDFSEPVELDHSWW